jgi:ABC-type glycerol-3-phosphate transport system permease component
MENQKVKAKKKISILKIVVFALFMLYAISLVLPFLWTGMASLMDWQEYNQDKFGWPEKLLFSNYLVAFTELNVSDTNLFGMTFNSLWLALGSSFLGVFVSSMVAYVLAKYKFFGRDFLYYTIIMTMMIPIVGALPAQYQVLNFLHLYNSPAFLLTATSGFGFNFLILYSIYKGIPWSYAEAGFVDGATHVRIYFQLIMPMVVPAMSAIFLTACITNWNDYMTPLLFLPSFPTLAAGLYTYQLTAARSDMPKYYAGVMLSMIPILVVFVLFQNTLMNLSIAGGLKG